MTGNVDLTAVADRFMQLLLQDEPAGQELFDWLTVHTTLDATLLVAALAGLGRDLLDTIEGMTDPERFDLIFDAAQTLLEEP